MKHKIILLLIILLYFFVDKFAQKQKTKIINLKKTKIKINDNIINLINKKDNALYSQFNMKTFESSVLYFNKIFENIIKEKNKKNILVLGFGLGGIPLRLSLENDIHNIDCVDTDNELFYYFKKLFPKHSNKIKLYLTDANKFLLNTKKYDIIIDDVFEGFNKIKLDYMKIKSKLNENGKLYINNYDINKKNILLFDTIKKIFGNVENNKIINRYLRNKLEEQSLYVFKNNI